MKADLIALDAQASNRAFDDNGYLHVKNNKLTQDQVAGYLGREIPDWEDRGLEPDRVYYAWRNPEELEKALSTFNGIPLLIEHKMDSAESPLKELRVGTVGSNARWEAPYLINDLAVWDEEAIKAIEDGSLKDLSCGYRYTPEWKSGKTPEGLEYDFIMRDIKCNHVALVQDGRAPDCFVSDSLPEELKMEENTKVEEKSEATDDFTEFARKAVEGAGVELTPEQVDALVRSFAEAHAEFEKGEAKEAEAETEGTRDEEGAVVDEDGKAEDEGEEKPETEEAKDEEKSDAMDANTVAKIVRAEIVAQYEASEAVKPFIGAVEPMAFDSADHIYAEAVKKMTGKAVALDSAKAVFSAVSSLKQTKVSAMDSKPSGVLAFLANKLNR